MKKIIFTFFLSLCSLFANNYEWQKGLMWQTSLIDAKQLAQYRGGKMLFLFIESRACFYCPKLKKEVLNQPAFQKKIKEHFVPVLLDNSLDYDSDVENQGQAPKRLTVSMTPAIYFMGPNEEKLARLGKKHMIIYGMWNEQQMLEWMDDAIAKYEKLYKKGGAENAK